MTSVPTHESESVGDPVDRRVLESKLDETRARYHELVGLLTDDQLALESVVTRWTVREVLCHMSRVMEIAFAMMVRRAKRNRPMPRLFHTRLVHWVNYRVAKRAAEGLDREQILQRYDAAHRKMVKLLEGVDDNQWSNRTAFPSGRPLTMMQIFAELVPGHFAAHAAEIEETVARSEGKEFDAPTYRTLIAPYS